MSYKNGVTVNNMLEVVKIRKYRKISVFENSEKKNFSKAVIFKNNINVFQDPTIRVTLMECWATPNQEPNGELQHFLIEDGCGVEEVLDGTLDIIENGESKMAKWAGSVFKFVGYDQVWLHCNIRVCFGDEDCLPGCNDRRKRRDSEEFELHTVSTSHPIRRLEATIELDEISIETSDSNGMITDIFTDINFMPIVFEILVLQSCF